jgi:hypothetical protein
LDYGDPVANSHSPPPPEYAVKEVGFRLDYGDPVANSHSPTPPEYDAVEDVGLPLNYGDLRENTPHLHLRSMQLKTLDCVLVMVIL